MKKALLLLFLLFLFNFRYYHCSISDPEKTVQYKITTNIPVVANVKWEIGGHTDTAQINGTELISPEYDITEDTTYGIEISSDYGMDFSGTFYVIFENKTIVQRDFAVTAGYVVTPALSIGPSGTGLSVTAFNYSINGPLYLCSGVPVGTPKDFSFSSGNTINGAELPGSFWGAWQVVAGNSGDVYTLPAGGLQDQAYTSEALAIAALPVVNTNIYYLIGYVTVQSQAGIKFTANTTNLNTEINIINFNENTPVLTYEEWIGDWVWYSL